MKAYLRTWMATVIAIAPDGKETGYGVIFNCPVLPDLNIVGAAVEAVAPGMQLKQLQTLERQPPVVIFEEDKV